MLIEDTSSPSHSRTVYPLWTGMKTPRSVTSYMRSSRASLRSLMESDSSSPYAHPRPRLVRAGAEEGPLLQADTTLLLLLAVGLPSPRHPHPDHPLLLSAKCPLYGWTAHPSRSYIVTRTVVSLKRPHTMMSRVRHQRVRTGWRGLLQSKGISGWSGTPTPLVASTRWTRRCGIRRAIWESTRSTSRRQ